MAKIKRRRIAASLEAGVLFQSDHTCCICRQRGKDVQIHHIDENSSNNSADNLAVVCLDCHSLVSGGRGLGKTYKRGEVRHYKRAWEKHVQNVRGIHKPRINYKKELVSQIDLIVCEILASRSDLRRVKGLLRVLYELHLWRGGPEINKKIVEGMSHLALMSGLDSGPLAALVAEKLWELCWHFVGPKDVSMNRNDANEVLGCVRALNALSYFTCANSHDKKNIQPILFSCERLFQIGLWYSNKRISNEVTKGYEQAIRGCYTDKKHLEFGFGRQAIRTSIRRLRKSILEIKPRWSAEMTRLEKLLSFR